MKIICPFRCRSVYVLSDNDDDDDDDETILTCCITS